MRPRVFVGSSSGKLDLAYSLHTLLQNEMEVTVWSEGVFTPSSTILDDLLRQLDKSDFGVFILSPEDTLLLGDRQCLAARDNVVFELGLFMGRLGKRRSFIVIPSNLPPDTHLPTDLLGINPVRYDASRQDMNLSAALGPVAYQISITIRTRWEHDCVKDDLAESYLKQIPILHREMAIKTHFIRADNILTEYLVTHHMSGYVNVLSESLHRNRLPLPSGPRLEAAKISIANAKKSVNAVSILKIDPWHKAGTKSSYVKANVKAAEKGIPVRRIFVVENESDQEQLHDIVRAKRQAGIKLRYEVHDTLLENYRNTTGDAARLVNVLICDGNLLSVSTEHSRHDGYLANNEDEIRWWQQWFNIVWDLARPFPN